LCGVLGIHNADDCRGDSDHALGMLRDERIERRHIRVGQGMRVLCVDWRSTGGIVGFAWRASPLHSAAPFPLGGLAHYLWDETNERKCFL
jgi:hypothetical protein